MALYLQKSSFVRDGKLENIAQHSFPDLSQPSLDLSSFGNDCVQKTTLCCLRLFARLDEAFVLLLIKNSYDRWTDLYKKTGGIPKQQRGVHTRTCASNVPPKYTQGGIKYSDANQKQTKGWTNQGIERYNKLFKVVTEDQRHKKFWIKFKEQQGGSKPKQLKDEPATIKAVHLLWEEDDKNLVEQEDDSSSEDEDNDNDDSDNEDG